MNIALVSYEYPPDTAYGGIATYVGQAARLLSQRGHRVEVFTSSSSREGSFAEDGGLIHRIRHGRREDFASAVLPVFSTRMNAAVFDVVESPEYNADGFPILRAFPELAHIVKLHTPSLLMEQCNTSGKSLRGQVRHYSIQTRALLGAWKRLNFSFRYRAYRPERVPPSRMYEREGQYAKAADLVVSPSCSLKDWAIEHWSLESSRVLVVPYPYIPSPALLEARPAANGKTVGFFGRLEQRKGLEALIAAIPKVLAVDSQVKFRFVGRAVAHPGTLEPYDRYIKRMLAGFENSVQVPGPSRLEDMPAQYAMVDTCVFPSIWENFPNVCLEAMAAGRAIIASNAGGMADMLEDGKNGLLVPPQQPDILVEAILHLIHSPELRSQLGTSARKRVLEAYNYETIGRQLEESFALAMRLKRNIR